MFANLRIFKNRGITPAQFPGVKKRRPIDILDQCPQRKGAYVVILDGSRSLVNADAQKFRLRWNIIAPINRRPVCACFLKRQQILLLCSCGMLPAQAFIVFARFLIERGLEFCVQERIDNTHRARGVQNVHNTCLIMRCDFHRCVRPARGRPANQQWQTKSFPLHLLRDMHHLVQ